MLDQGQVSNWNFLEVHLFRNPSKQTSYPTEAVPPHHSPVMKLMVELSQQLNSGSPQVTMVTRKL